jgi:hypothetical protein
VLNSKEFESLSPASTAIYAVNANSAAGTQLSRRAGHLAQANCLPGWIQSLTEQGKKNVEHVLIEAFRRQAASHLFEKRYERVLLAAPCQQ